MKKLRRGALVEVEGPNGRHFIGKVTGTGARRDPAAGPDAEPTTMYEISRRYLNGNEFQFAGAGTWVLPEHVTKLDRGDVPTVAGLCHGCGVPITLSPDRVWRHVGNPDDVRAEHREHAEQRWSEKHPVFPAPRTAELANIWDIDAATGRQYPVTDIPLSA